MKIITGRTGELHVTSDDDRHLHAGTFGEGKYILNTASKLNATNPSSNVVRLAKGDIIFQGCHARIEDYEDVEITPGTEGYSRIDLICCQYKKVGGVESTELVVYTGTPATSNPTIPTPTYGSNNILDGAEIADMPLFKITITGVNINKIELIAQVQSNMSDFYTKDTVYNKEQINTKFNEVYKKAETYSKQEIDSTDERFEKNDNHIREGLSEGIRKCTEVRSYIDNEIAKIDQGQTVNEKDVLMLLDNLTQRIIDTFTIMSDRT